MRFTLFRQLDSVGTVFPVEDLDRDFSHRPFADKAAAPLFSPATFRGGQRSNATAQGVDFGVLDFDDLEPEQVPRLRQILEGLACAYLMLSSHRYTPEHPKLRLLLPFDRTVTPQEWTSFWRRLAHIFDDLPDEQCKDIAHFYYVPTHPPGATPFREARLDRPSLKVAQVLQTHLPASALAKAHASTPISRNTLERLERKWLKADRPEGGMLGAVLRGESYAPPGARDNATFALARALVAALPDGDPTSIASYFHASCSRMALDSPGAPTPSDVYAKLLRLQHERLQGLESADRAELARNESLSLASPANIEDFPPGFNPKFYVLQSAPSFFVYAGTSRGYAGPYQAAELPSAMERLLFRARSEVQVTMGDGSYKSVPALMREYGTQVDNVEASYLTDVSTFDPASSTLTLAAGRRTDIEPQYHEEIDAWLGIMGGEVLRQWVAYVTHLDSPCVALALCGAPGTGKTLLATGLGKLWKAGEPCSMETAFAAFNTPLLGTPLILADEHIPRHANGRARTEDLRVLVQSRAAEVNRKYAAPLTVKGANRVIITTNSDHPFRVGNSELNENDVKAIADRLLVITPSPQAAEFLASVDTSEWVEGNLIAQHALWLRDQIPLPVTPSRFLIDPPDKSFARKLAVAGEDASLVCAWLVHWLLAEPKSRATPINLRDVLCFSEGSLWLQPSFMLDNWGAFQPVGGKPAPSPDAFGRLLRRLGLTGQRRLIRRPSREKYVWYRELEISRLADWCENTGIFEVEEVIEALQKLRMIDDAAYAALPPAPPLV